jgi:transposase
MATAGSWPWPACSGFPPFLEKLFADGGYQGPRFRNALAKVLPRLSVDVVKRSDGLQGFKVLPRRWVVERSFAWLNGADDWPSISRT